LYVVGISAINIENDNATYSVRCYLYIPVRTTYIPKKNLDKLQKDDPIKFALHVDTLDQGTEAFMQWLGSDDKMSTSNHPIILKQYEHNKYAVLYDNTLGYDVTVETHDGVPFCKTCNTDDCGHVGFTILLDQKYENDGSIID
jgi:hypothetical protein